MTCQQRQTPRPRRRRQLWRLQLPLVRRRAGASPCNHGCRVLQTLCCPMAAQRPRPLPGPAAAAPAVHGSHCGSSCQPLTRDWAAWARRWWNWITSQRLATSSAARTHFRSSRSPTSPACAARHASMWVGGCSRPRSAQLAYSRCVACRRGWAGGWGSARAVAGAHRRRACALAAHRRPGSRARRAAPGRAAHVRTTVL